MAHIYPDTSGMQKLVLHQRENNLDKKDNLDLLPEQPAVYGICGRVNDQTANCRYVGHTDNLRRTVKSHFAADEPDACLRNFMQSIKIKELVYTIMPGSATYERENKKAEWERQLQPVCNDQLNQVY